VTYQNAGFSAVSLTFQAANDSSGSPGSWGTYQGTAQSGAVSTGSNPSTSTTTGYAVFTGYAPWVRVTATLTGSGSVKGFVTGWYSVPTGSGGGGGGVISCSGSGCVVIGPTPTGSAPTTAPVYVSGRDGAGNVIPLQSCTLSTVFDISASGNTQVIAPLSGKVIRVCHWSFTTTVAQNAQLVYGTGSNCATGGTNLSGLNQSVLAVAFDWGPDAPLLAASSSALCVSLSSSTRTTGTITYAQY
jgi:hypothetical protein